jgi:hypothetical protein
MIVPLQSAPAALLPAGLPALLYCEDAANQAGHRGVSIAFWTTPARLRPAPAALNARQHGAGMLINKRNHGLLPVAGGPSVDIG